MNHDFYCDEVLTGRLPVKVVYETPRVLAFHHTHPLWPVHIVVIPKEHVESFVTLQDGDLLAEMFSVLQIVMRQVNEEHGGCRLTTNIGGCQTTRHLHWHVYVAKEMLA